MPKNGPFIKTWRLRSNSVTRHVSFDKTEIGWKCQNWKIKSEFRVAGRLPKTDLRRRLFWLFLPSVHNYQKRLTSEDLREVWRITRLLFCGSRRLGTSKKASAFSDVEQQRRRFCYHIIMRNFLFSFIVEKNFEEKFGPLCRGPSDTARIFITLQVSDPALMSNNKSADFSVFFKSFLS